MKIAALWTLRKRVVWNISFGYTLFIKYSSKVMSSKKEIHVLHVSCCDGVCLITHLVNTAFLISLEKDNLMGFKAIQLPTSTECLQPGKTRGILVRLCSQKNKADLSTPESRFMPCYWKIFHVNPISPDIVLTILYQCNLILHTMEKLFIKCGSASFK